ncbi:UNVERIFIED_CONTAM: hypothetical protein ABIC26_005260 [Paenibacillus sp. PvR008]
MFTVKQTTPLFRIFDEAKAKEFYLDYLGFQLDWEHRYEPGMPLYVQVTLGDATIHLNEHHGDCSPWIVNSKSDNFFNFQMRGSTPPSLDGIRF